MQINVNGCLSADNQEIYGMLSLTFLEVATVNDESCRNAALCYLNYLTASKISTLLLTPKKLVVY